MKKLIRSVRQHPHLQKHERGLKVLDKQVEAFMEDYESHGLFSSRDLPDRQAVHISNIFKKSARTWGENSGPAEHALSIKNYASHRWPGAWGLMESSDEDEEDYGATLYGTNDNRGPKGSEESSYPDGGSDDGWS